MEGKNYQTNYSNRPEEIPPDIEAYLIVDGIAIRVTASNFSIGRALENNLVLNDTYVAQVHGEIQFAHSHFYIVNKSPDHQLFVNGEPVHVCNLYTGDTLQFGHTKLAFAATRTTFKNRARKISGKLKKITEKIISFVLY